MINQILRSEAILLFDQNIHHVTFSLERKREK